MQTSDRTVDCAELRISLAAWSMLLRLAIFLCSVTLARASAATLQDCSSLRPTHLTIEYEDAQQPQEVGALPATIIDIPNPRFSWRLETASDPSARNCTQGAWEVEVVTDSGTTVWHSGRVEGSQQVHIEYGGETLASSTNTSSGRSCACRQIPSSLNLNICDGGSPPGGISGMPLDAQRREGQLGSLR